MSWRYCRIALEFFREHRVPFWEMTNADSLVGNGVHAETFFCLAKPGELYLVYLPWGGRYTATLDLRGATGEFNVRWFNPRTGGPLLTGNAVSVTGGGRARLGVPPADETDDWLVMVRR